MVSPCLSTRWGQTIEYEGVLFDGSVNLEIEIHAQLHRLLLPVQIIIFSLINIWTGGSGV